MSKNKAPKRLNKGHYNTIKWESKWTFRSGKYTNQCFGNPKGIEAFSPAVATKELPWVNEKRRFINPERC
jgi:hypothetical protein